LARVVTVRLGDKPEVKKAGGVFYTPAFIVDFIIRETVGTLAFTKAVRNAVFRLTTHPKCRTIPL
jgi:hypothetical protein